MAVGLATMVFVAEVQGQQARVIRNLDEPLVEELHERGVRMQRARATVWFARDLLVPADQERWADLISKGIDDIETFLDVPLGQPRLEYYVDESIGLTSRSVRGSPGRVFLSGSRVKSGAAPYLHEAVHHFIFRYTREKPTPSSNPFPLWIVEGFAGYVEDQVAARNGGISGRVFTKTGNQGVDAEAREVLTTSIGGDVLAFVGRPGEPKGIFVDREHVARSFYVLAQSFTKYLVDEVGIRRFVKDLLPVVLETDTFSTRLQRIDGRNLEQFRAAWLAKLRDRA